MKLRELLAKLDDLTELSLNIRYKDIYSGKALEGYSDALKVTLNDATLDGEIEEISSQYDKLCVRLEVE